MRRSTTSGTPRRAAVALAALWMLATAGITTAHAAQQGAASPALRTAGLFMLDDIRFKVDGKWGLVWHTLYPAHRLVAPRAIYVHCEEATPFPAALESAQLVAVHRADVHVPGLAHPVAGAAVTVRLSFQGYGPRDPMIITHTFHLVPVNGHWTWLLSPQRYALYRHDGCGSFPVA